MAEQSPHRPPRNPVVTPGRPAVGDTRAAAHRMKSSTQCPRCEHELPPTAPLGLCSQCLLRSILEPEPQAAQADAPAALPAGTPDRTFGDYELLGVLARGGMGVVYRARQRSLNRLVALKLIRAGEFADEAERKRFQAEAEAAAHLDHPNIVPVYEVGEHAGQAYFAMKLIEGGSLATWLLNTDRLITEHSRTHEVISGQYSVSSVATLMAKISRAVHYAHQRGVLHRDLKPSNLLLDAQGEPFVTDFGLAKRLESGPDLTLSGAVLGTPNYMSPEQAAGRTGEITTATDIFSLGAILYELLAGRPPFQADTPLATLRKVVEEEPAPPSQVRRGVASDQWSVISGQTSAHKRPSLLGLLNTEHWSLNTPPSATALDLETICLKCLQKNPAHRYATAEALAEDLERWLRHEPIRARPSTAGERALKWTRRHPARAALLAVSVAAVVGFMILNFTHGRTLQGERDHAVQLGQQAAAAATRAEAGELAASERAYAADLYAASQALAANDLAQARRLLDEHRPKGMASDELRLRNGPAAPTRSRRGDEAPSSQTPDAKLQPPPNQSLLTSSPTTAVGFLSFLQKWGGS